MRKIPKSLEEKILRRLLEGATYRQAASESGVGTTTVHRVFEDARRRTPDIDDLRQLNAALQKAGVSLVDAVRACPTLSRLNELGVGIDQLSTYIDASKKLAEERQVESSELVESSMRLVEIQSKTGKPAYEIAREFEEMGSKIEELNRRLEALRGELQHAEKQREISQLCEQLRTIGVQPSRLREFLEKRGSFERQLQAVEEKMRDGEARLKILTKMEGDLRRRVEDIKRVDSLLQQRYQSFICAYCGAATPHEVRRFEVQSAMAMGQPLYVGCLRCGATNTYDARTILMNLGLEVLS